MPAYVDFISLFAVNAREGGDEISDLRFSGFREVVRLSPGYPGLSLRHLGLGGRGYQMSFNLKCVANQSMSSPEWPNLPRNEWSWHVRQAAVHHQFDVEKGTTLWILTAARDHLQTRVEALTGQASDCAGTLRPIGRAQDRDFSDTEKSFVASISVHLMLAQWASEDWRGYIRWMEQELEKFVSQYSSTFL